MMTDRTTGSAIRVVTDVAVGPYIRLPYDRLEEVRRALDNRGFRYRVKENVVSLSGGPFIAVVNLDRGADADAVQAILDSLP